MNLRLDEQSIRLRLLRDEAATLLSEGALTGCLPHGSKSLAVKIATRSQGRLDVLFPSNDEWQFFVPKPALELMLREYIPSASRPIFEMSETQQIQERSIEIRFEVDRMSNKPRRKQND